MQNVVCYKEINDEFSFLSKIFIVVCNENIPQRLCYAAVVIIVGIGLVVVVVVVCANWLANKHA